MFILSTRLFRVFLFLIGDCPVFSASFQQSSLHPFKKQIRRCGVFHLTAPRAVAGSPDRQVKDQKRLAASVSASILDALRKRTSGPGDDHRHLHVAKDLFDNSTGLHSEGVWHNAMAGIASVRAGDFDSANRIADSLWTHSWDGTSFRRRAWSGNWDHTNLDDVEQGAYYEESSEHRCVQHGMALIFWSELVMRQSSYSPSEATLTTTASQRKHQQKILASCFRDEFWDERVSKWTTVSASQGGGTVSRPSASAGKVTAGVESDTRPYYRAVDQAVAVLACLAHCRLLQDQGDDDQVAGELTSFTGLLQRTYSELMTAFGYANDDTVRTYIGLDRNQNSWHYLWVLLALVSALPYTTDCGEEELRSLLEGFVDRYGHLGKDSAFDGTIWHWPRSLKMTNENVRYCGDNALLYAITRQLGWVPVDAGGLSEYQSGFWEFMAELTSRQEDGLASVADVYKQVRLHPNTELAALLVWP